MLFVKELFKALAGGGLDLILGGGDPPRNSLSTHRAACQERGRERDSALAPKPQETRCDLPLKISGMGGGLSFFNGEQETLKYDSP